MISLIGLSHTLISDIQPVVTNSNRSTPIYRYRKKAIEKTKERYRRGTQPLSSYVLAVGTRGFSKAIVNEEASLMQLMKQNT